MSAWWIATFVQNDSAHGLTKGSLVYYPAGISILPNRKAGLGALSSAYSAALQRAERALIAVKEKKHGTPCKTPTSPRKTPLSPHKPVITEIISIGDEGDDEGQKSTLRPMGIVLSSTGRAPGAKEQRRYCGSSLAERACQSTVQHFFGPTDSSFLVRCRDGQGSLGAGYQ